MLIADWEYFLRKSLRRVKGKFLRAQQRGLFSRHRLLRLAGAFLLTSLVLSISPEAGSEISSAAPAPLGDVAGTAASGQVKGEQTFKTLATEVVRGPVRIPDSPDLGEITAKAALFVDFATGTVFWEREPQLVLPLASTTKLMTALVAIDIYPLVETVEISSPCASLTDTQGMRLTGGEKISVENLLSGMLITSAGDAACALSQHGKGVEDFVGKMNEKAHLLGLTSTHFTNPVGNDEVAGKDNEGTVADLLVLAKEFWWNNFLQETVGLTEKTVTSSDGTVSHLLKTTNELLISYPGVKGIKTGYTVKAKDCFVSFYEQGGRQILGIILGSDDRFGETKKILDWIFAVYRWPS